jgi:hypothetical protein
MHVGRARRRHARPRVRAPGRGGLGESASRPLSGRTAADRGSTTTTTKRAFPRSRSRAGIRAIGAHASAAPTMWWPGGVWLAGPAIGCAAGPRRPPPSAQFSVSPSCFVKQKGHGQLGMNIIGTYEWFAMMHWERGGDTARVSVFVNWGRSLGE